MQSTSKDDVDVESLGKRIRFLRKAKQLTLVQVAGATGLSAGFLSQVENGQTNISLSALYRVARALETTAPELLAQGDEPLVSVVRKDEGPWLSVDSDDPPQLARSLTSTPRIRVEARECLIPSGFRSEPAWSHMGEEVVFVLEGSFSVEVAGHGTETLHPGDSMVFPANVPHRWIGGEADTRILNVIALPGTQSTGLNPIPQPRHATQRPQ